MPYTDPTQTPAWQQLAAEFQRIQSSSLVQLFNQDTERAERYSFEFENVFFDLSKNWVDEGVLSALLSLADQMQLKSNIDAMFDGDTINNTEQRPALHTALRASHQHLQLDGEDIQARIDAELEKIADFCQRLHSQQLLGSHGVAIDTIINIGIGGSDLGPRFVNDALSTYAVAGLRTHFVANIDITELNKVLEQCKPESTLVIIASKSFTTLETMMNARAARAWFQQNGCEDLARHFVAVTANKQAAAEFGIEANNIFAFWSWVGGRYSVWSSIGLPIAAFLGMNQFKALLDGAAHMDEHFKTTEASENIPVLLALLDVMYSNFAAAQTLAIVPYDQNLKLLPDYLSQLIMESNGKSVNRNGETIHYKTAPIVWGSVGTNSQHAFFQLLHQGTHIVPIDFLVGKHNQYAELTHQQALYANCMAQSEALMIGQTLNANEPYRFTPGNKPSTTIVYETLDAKTLGMLLALYEHRTFVQGAIYNINSFDQWGVELGKKLAAEIMSEFSKHQLKDHHDASTCQLMKKYFSD